MSNLLEETLEKLKRYGLKEEDVLWVGSQDGEYAISWEEFKKIADVEYDDDYGAPKIAMDLVVVGKDWWLERCEYDGAEWWELKTLPMREPNAKSFKYVCVNQFRRIGWEKLADLNKEG